MNHKQTNYASVAGNAPFFKWKKSLLLLLEVFILTLAHKPNRVGIYCKSGNFNDVMFSWIRKFNGRDLDKKSLKLHFQLCFMQKMVELNLVGFHFM